MPLNFLHIRNARFPSLVNALSSRPVIGGVEILLVLFLAERAAALAVLALSSQTLPTAPALLDPVSASAPARVTFTFDPFHRGPAAEAVAEVAAPETLLELELFGVRLGSVPGEGTAIIRTPDLRQAAYGIGEEVMAGTTIAAIHPDRVTLLRNGAQESLWLAGAPRPSDEPAGGLRPAGGPRAGAGGDPGPIRIPAATAARLSSGFIALVQPRIGPRGMEGVVIRADADPATLGAVGLRPGDVVLAVDGTPLSDLQNAGAAMARLGSTGRLRLSLLRGTVPLEVDLELEGAP